MKHNPDAALEMDCEACIKMMMYGAERQWRTMMHFISIAKDEK